MGKFEDIVYKDTISAVTDFHQDLLNQDFWLFNDKSRGTKVTYYNINLEKSSLDPGSGLAYTDIGEDSPLRFNVIHDLFIYEMPRLDINMNFEDFGLESEPLTGESYVLPNTIKPTAGDFFTMEHVNQNNPNVWLFKVRETSFGQLSDGSQAWKLSWVLDRTTDQDILKNVVEDYQYINRKEGTNIRTVVELDKYKKAVAIENVTESLRVYFIDLFYNDKVQTFTYDWFNPVEYMHKFYDPFAIEFIIRHNLLSGAHGYVHVMHQTEVPKTFSIDYNRSIYRALEKQDVKKLKHYSYKSQADLIDDPTSIFATRYDDFFILSYNVINEPNGPFNPRGIIPIMDECLVQMIQENKKYECIEYNYRNIIIKYFNGEDLDLEDLEDIEQFDVQDTGYVYYEMLYLIYILDYYTKKLLS